MSSYVSTHRHNVKITFSILYLQSRLSIFTNLTSFFYLISLFVDLYALEARKWEEIKTLFDRNYSEMNELRDNVENEHATLHHKNNETRFVREKDVKRVHCCRQMCIPISYS